MAYKKPLPNLERRPLKIKRGDDVVVIKGKSKGMKGKVLKVLIERERVIVEKVNMIKRHTRPNPQTGQGGVVEREGSIHISNVMLIDPGTKSRTRVGYTIGADGEKVRVAKKSNEVLVEKKPKAKKRVGSK